MKAQRNKYLLFNWLFISGLVLLALNDHFLKWQFSNWFTGKISDVVGLFILPMFILFIFPKLKTYAISLCGLFFIFWKLPVSESFINTYNQFSIIPIVRTIDYSDLFALIILPASHFFIKRIERYRLINNPKYSLSPLFLLIPSCLIFMATSPPISYYMKPDGDIHIGKYYKMKVSKDVVLMKLKEEGYSVKVDTAKKDSTGVDYYVIENVVFSNKKDTIKSLEFGFMGNLILVNNIRLNGDFKVSEWRELKRYSKYYKKLIKAGIIEEVNHK